MSMTTASEKFLNPIQEVIDYDRKRGRIELMTGILGLNSLRNSIRQSEKNQQAENEYVRKTIWGKAAEKEDSDDMQQTVLGDLTTNITNQSSLGKALVGLGLLATGIGGGIGSYLIADAIKNKPAPVIQKVEQQPTVKDTDTDTVIEWTLE